MSDTCRVLRSTITADGSVRITIVDEPMPTPGPDEVVVAVEAAPINPSDLGMLTAGADPATFERSADGALVGRLSEASVAANAARLDTPMPVGNEGAGTVVAAGSADGAQALLGRTVAGVSGSMYATHTKLSHAMCIPVPDGVSAADAASSFVNPLTALGMTDTMRLEGHTALLHTAAASNLGQMLNRLCQADGIALVNVVRRDEQAELLRSQGATHVVVSSADSFEDDLTAALTETGATIAFDAIGGGTQVDTILACMERACSAGAQFSRYGSDTHKQVYIYGGLDRSPTPLKRTYGMSWGVGGWLLTPFLGRVGFERMGELRDRVAAEITTTFASSYAETISLDAVLDPATARAYAAQATGEKRLVTPST
ncbi:MAG: zinc-binding dehydrogenase [Actinomycetota bacterium]